ncbi:MAG: Fe-S oxidoreductase [Nitrospirae bacterium]|nr:Fe-S oxidoreductase [Nitrospirota bacterium]MBS1232730.1 Fe-S oxidoreductase [Nitrospirota bacterium]
MENAYYLDQLSKCVRCGSCKAFCPTYDEDSTETMGARGRLALLLGLASGTLTPSPALHERIFSCTLCGACSGQCPPGVDIKELIYHGRSILKNDDKKRQFIRRLVKFSIKKPNLSFRLLGMTQHLFMPYLLKKGLVPFHLELPDRPLRDNVKVVSVSQRKGRVAIFTGCMVNFLYPNLGESLINVLHTLGYEVILPATEVCCGAPLRTLGLEEEAQELARKNVELFSKLNVEAVLSLCPTCTLTIQREYPALIGEGIQKAQDISSFLADKIASPGFPGRPSPAKTVLYHDPCHLKYGLSIEKEPREIIENMGFDLIKTDGDRCCGFAGIFCFTFQELSHKLLNTCVNDYAKSGAEMIITSCPGCILQLSNGCKDKQVVHLIEVIEKAIVQKPVFSLS